jgi:hypothetical protein
MPFSFPAGKWKKYGCTIVEKRVEVNTIAFCRPADRGRTGLDFNNTPFFRRRGLRMATGAARSDNGHMNARWVVPVI